MIARRAAVLAVLAAVPAAAQSPGPDPRPAFHYAPQRGWMNDPNGLVWFDGEYHLFYQHNPYGDRFGHIGWGHAVSRDLVRWQELPVAIPETDRMAFSGSAAIDWMNSGGFAQAGRPAMVALFTGYDPETRNQSQYLAYSTDRGRSFTRWGKVLDIGSTEFRDPRLFWHAATHRWVMVLVRATENRVAIYTSPDLRHWTHASDFGPAGARGRAWECPDLFALPVEGTGATRWVMTVNVSDGAPGGGSGGQWFVGDFDGMRFVPDPGSAARPHWSDRGADFYAAVSWNGVPDGRRIWIGWANDWRYAASIPTYPARGLMTLPRTLALRREGDDWALVQRPVAELDRYRRDPVRTGAIALGERPVALPMQGDRIDARLSIDPGDADQVTIALTDAAGWQTLIGVTPATHEMFVDRTRSGPHFHDAFPDRHVAALPAARGPIALRLIVDRSIVELSGGDGTRWITDRFFRGRGALTWSASAIGGHATIPTLDADRIAMPDAG